MNSLLWQKEIAGKDITINHIYGPVGVRGRNSDNTLIETKLEWKPHFALKDGMTITYTWVNEQVEKSKNIKKYPDIHYLLTIGHIIWKLIMIKQ